jgi:adenine-specific DNA-methyltransferase
MGFGCVKYMGSKRTMLRNGLGELLSEQVPTKKRFFDLFCGSGSVAGHVAQNFSIPVFAGDLQKYAVILAAAQIQQTNCFSSRVISRNWKKRAYKKFSEYDEFFSIAKILSNLTGDFEEIRRNVAAARIFCANLPLDFFISRAYGGYYYSPYQAMLLDIYRDCLSSDYRIPSLASLISAASVCAAAPGHTAQPFSTKDSALPHLVASWSKDIELAIFSSLERYSIFNAKVPGKAMKLDALSFAKKMKGGDLAFIDPPYSEVQYSRFYHVLETVARGNVGDVSGVGRYPSLSQRPQSDFCRSTQSTRAFLDLMASVAESGADAIITFPADKASNGLSGKIVEEISAQFFNIKIKKVSSIFSTLGGNSNNRDARKSATELILYLASK